MKALILAGGKGTRLWPLSREDYPKQFLSLDDQGSFLQKTVKRIAAAIPLEDIYIITGYANFHDVMNQVKVLFPVMKDNVIMEPCGRNTAPAIALGIRYILEKRKISDNEVFFISPSDHLIPDEEAFARHLHKGEAIAKEGFIVTFGITPSKPETAYGYVKKGKAIASSEGFTVEAFVEKPDMPTAIQFVTSGQYLWNGGMFSFTAKTMLDEMRSYAPIIQKTAMESYTSMVDCFPSLPNISIDYAVMEKSKRMAVLPMNLVWSDIGCWDSLYDVLEKDAHENVKIGNVVDLHTKNSLIVGDKRLISTIGLENMLVVETPDALFIAKRGCSQQVKELVEKLNNEKRREAKTPATLHRPWGHFTVLDKGSGYQMRRVVLDPLTSTGTQLHRHRSEHWIIVKGSVKVTIDGQDAIVWENQSIYIPKETKHRLENIGETPVEIVEIQVGAYLYDDDIVRFDESSAIS